MAQIVVHSFQEVSGGIILEEMTRRQRVWNTLHYKPADKVPVRYYYCPVGYFEHGDKLNGLYAELPGDFEPFRRIPPAGPAENDYDINGRYHAFRTDEWGVEWEYRIFGIAGLPHRRPCLSFFLCRHMHIR